MSCRQIRLVVVSISVGYLGACGFAGALLLADIEGALRMSPGDSLMALVAASMFAGAIWWIVWTATWSTVAVFRIKRAALGELVVSAIAISLLAWMISLTEPLFSTQGEGGVTVLSIVLACILPAAGGACAGMCLVRQSPKVAGSKGLTSIIIVIATLCGGTFLWWPREAIIAMGRLWGIRRQGAEWAGAESLLLARLGVCCILFVLTLVCFVLAVRMGNREGKRGNLETQGEAPG